MKCVLTAVNSKYIHSSLAVWYLHAALPQSTVLEFTINQDPQAVLAQILAEKPDLLGFSCYIWNISYIKALLPQIRAALPQCTLVLGGPEVSHNPEDYSGLAHHVICGYGEQALVDLYDKLCRKEPCPAILHGSCGQVPPDPYTNDYFAALGGRIAYLEGSRGCPFTCGFCLSGIDEQPLYFPIEQVQERIVRLANSGTKTIKFVDRTFNAHKSRAAQLWRFILNCPDIPEGVCFHFEIGADLLTQEHLDILRQAPAGKFQLEIGLQSFHTPTLAAVQRKTAVDKSVDNIGLLVDNSNMHIHIDLIVGLPYESFFEFRNSFNTAYGLGAHMLQMGFLKLLHGSALRRDANNYAMDYSADPPYEIRSLDCMSGREIAQLKLLEDVLERLYNSGRFSRTLAFLLQAEATTPFDLFLNISQGISYNYGISLDDFTELLYNYFQRHGQPLRDALVQDRLAWDNTGLLPRCLHVEDGRLSQEKKAIARANPPKKGVRRGVALLYATGQAVWCDYVRPHPVTGYYPLQYKKIGEL